VTGRVLQYIPVLLAWAAVAYQAPIRRHHGRGRRNPAFWLGLLFLALSLTILLPSVSLWIDRLSGLANGTRLVGHVLVLVAASAIQVYLLQLNYPDERGRWRIQRRISALAGTLALLVMFFVLAPVHREALDFWGRYGSAPFILPYRLVFVGYLGWALVTVVRLCWRYAGMSEHPATTAGLRLVAIGGVLGLGYCIHEGLRVVGSALGIADPVLDSNTVTQVLIASGVGLMVIGCTMPAWGPHIGIPALVIWLRRHRAYRHLYPLWRDLHQVSPEIALLRPLPRLIDALILYDLDFRLYRRVVEIRDGILALRPYRDSETARSALNRCRAAGLGDETQIVVEAASLAAALEAKRSGHPAKAGSVTTGSVGGADVPSEVLALERLARCYTRSPIVRAVRAEVRRRMKTSGPPPVQRIGRA